MFIIYIVKKVSDFPVPKLFPARESLVSDRTDIPAGDWKVANFFGSASM
jgi:hypothetical protein